MIPFDTSAHTRQRRDHHAQRRLNRSDLPQPRWARGPVRPLRFPQYRVLALALSLGLIAAGMWLIALVWLVIEIGGGPAQLSLVAVGPALGIVLTSLAGGVLADRVPQRKILISVFTVKAVMVVVATTLAWTDRIEFWHLALIGLAVGMADGFEYPAYSALLPSIVPPGDLLAANGIEGMIRPAFMQGLGPVFAGAAIASYSPTAALALVAILEAVTAAFLFRLRPTPLRRDLSTDQELHPCVLPPSISPTASVTWCARRGCSPLSCSDPRSRSS